MKRIFLLFAALGLVNGNIEQRLTASNVKLNYEQSGM